MNATATAILDPHSLGTPLAIGGTAEIYALGDERVLKLYWHGASRTAPEREAERARAAHAAGAPCPAVLEIVAVLDRFGAVFERVHGPNMLSAIAAEPDRAEAMMRELARLHAHLHACTRPALPAQREHLTQRIALAPLNHRLRSSVLVALSRLPQGDSLCHGDFYPGNVLLGQSGPAIIDWFDAVSGHPAADVARTLLRLQYGKVPPNGSLERMRSKLTTIYLHEYRSRRDMPSDLLQAWALPVATARLAESIAGQERATLVRLIEEMLEPRSGLPDAALRHGRLRHEMP